VQIAERDEIYRAYWDGTCDNLPRLAALTAFDMSINAGPLATRKLIQAALGLKSDGVFGPVTLTALRNLQQFGVLNGQVEVFTLRLLMERMVFYRILAKNAVLRPNLFSWVARVTDFYTDHVRDA
jgi:lysozyme family protein